MLSIVQEFEAERSTDSDDVKRQRFERVLDIMQQMQSSGHPPKELVGELVGLQLNVYISSWLLTGFKVTGGKDAEQIEELRHVLTVVFS